MYTGHLGIALAGKGVRPSVPLWVLIGSAQACDWLNALVWPLGHADPYSTRWLIAGNWTARMASHSLPSVLGLGIVLAVLYYATMRDVKGAWLVAGVTLSHVLADYVTAQTPTWPGGPRVGLSLYHDTAADLVVETGVVCCGWLLYRRSLPRGHNPATAWLMLGSLIALQVAADVILRRVLAPD